MMKETVKNLGRTYLKMECGKQVTEYKEKVLLKNKINGLVHMDKRHIDDQSCYYYDVTAMRSLKDKFQRENMDREYAGGIFQSMREVCRNLEDYLLDEADICLLPDYIFEHVETRQIYFLYLPDRENRQNEEAEQLTEFLIDHMSNGETRYIDGLYTFYNEQLIYGEDLTAAEYCRLWEECGIKPEAQENACLQEEIPPYIPDDSGWNESPSGIPHKLWQRKIYKVPYNGREAH